MCDNSCAITTILWQIGKGSTRARSTAWISFNATLAGDDTPCDLWPWGQHCGTVSLWMALLMIYTHLCTNTVGLYRDTRARVTLVLQFCSHSHGGSTIVSACWRRFVRHRWRGVPTIYFDDVLWNLGKLVHKSLAVDLVQNASGVVISASRNISVIAHQT